MTEDTLQLQIELVDVPDDEANALATELSDDIVDATPDVDIQRGRTDPLAQDFGATLILLLGTSAVTALAEGIGRYLARRSTSTVKIKDGKGGEIVVDGVSSRSATRIAERILELQSTRS